MPVLSEIDKINAQFAKDLDKVLSSLETKVAAMVGGAKTSQGAFDAAALLNSGAQLSALLAESGYTALAEKHIAQYEIIAAKVIADFDAQDLPPPQFTTANIQTLQQIAKSDMEQFQVIGTTAVESLKRELYQHAIATRGIDAMVESIRKAIGPDSVLSRYAYTYANTAILQFAGQATIIAGESIGADEWYVIGPNDQVTRSACRHALGMGNRTKEAWIKYGYWGGTPGGWNCRHWMSPWFGDGKK